MSYVLLQYPHLRKFAKQSFRNFSNIIIASWNLRPALTFAMYSRHLLIKELIKEVLSSEFRVTIYFLREVTRI